MATIGWGLRIASKSPVPNKAWNVLGIVAHIPPLLAIVLFGYLFEDLGIAYLLYASLGIHGASITIELLTLAFVKQAPQLQTQA